MREAFEPVAITWDPPPKKPKEDKPPPVKLPKKPKER